MTQHPVLLDSHHPLTGLIVLDAHSIEKHNGVSKGRNQVEVLDCTWAKLQEDDFTMMSFVDSLKDEHIIHHLHPVSG